MDHARLSSPPGLPVSPASRALQRGSGPAVPRHPSAPRNWAATRAVISLLSLRSFSAEPVTVDTLQVVSGVRYDLLVTLDDGVRAGRGRRRGPPGGQGRRGPLAGAAPTAGPSGVDHLRLLGGAGDPSAGPGGAVDEYGPALTARSPGPGQAFSTAMRTSTWAAARPARHVPSGRTSSARPGWRHRRSAGRTPLRGLAYDVVGNTATTVDTPVVPSRTVTTHLRASGTWVRPDHPRPTGRRGPTSGARQEIPAGAERLCAQSDPWQPPARRPGPGMTVSAPLNGQSSAATRWPRRASGNSRWKESACQRSRKRASRAWSRRRVSASAAGRGRRRRPAAAVRRCWRRPRRRTPAWSGRQKHLLVVRGAAALSNSSSSTARSQSTHSAAPIRPARIASSTASWTPPGARV